MIKFKAVGLLSPGDMGHAVGRVLLDHGMPVVTCLEGRSERTRALAQKAGIESVPTYGELVKETDLILSIMVPTQVESAAKKISHALKDTGQRIVYADCNAVSPETVLGIEKIIREAGSCFVDVGILGPPPREKGTTRFYASGPDMGKFEILMEYGLDVRVAGPMIGQASGFKMCYAALTKGTAAISTELLIAARRMGFFETMIDELQSSQSEQYSFMERFMHGMPPKSRRWIGEMEEIAKTFEDLGLTARIFQGAADIYRYVGETRLADETPETLDQSRTLEQVIKILAEKNQ